MNRLIAIVLICVQMAVFAIPVALITVRIQMRQQARIAALQKVPSEEHTRIVLSENDYKLALRDEGKELYYAGCMHDIVCVQDRCDSVVVLCIRDDAETALHAAINTEQNNAMHRDGRVKHLIQLIVSGQNAVLPVSGAVFLPSTNMAFLHATPDCINRYCAPLVRPPRCVVDHI